MSLESLFSGLQIIMLTLASGSLIVYFIMNEREIAKLDKTLSEEENNIVYLDEVGEEV